MTAAMLRSRRVLLAEDNPANRKLALAMLGKLGYAADAAANGLEAVEAVRKLPYDLVLMDCRMPEMDGFEATGEIRRRETSSHIPIIAMTADAMEGDRLRCLDAGMDDYLSKPVSFEALSAVLERWVPPPLDPAIISGLRQLGEGREGDWLPRLVSEFFRSAASDIERLRHAVENGDLPEVFDRSHALAGSVATFGAREMGRLCSRLKTLAAHWDLEAGLATMAEIESEFDRASAALRAEFPDPPGGA